MNVKPIAIFLMVALSATLGFCQDASTHVIVSIHFSRGWDMTVHKDGGAILVRGAFDHIRVPAGTFDFRLWEAECIRARDGSQKMGVSYKDHGFVEIGTSKMDIGSAETTMGLLTPEIKAYVDRMLEEPLSDRMRSITNEAPVFTFEVLEGLRKWTNSPQSHFAVEMPQANSGVQTEVTKHPDLAPSRPPTTFEKMKPSVEPPPGEPSAVEGNDKILGFRGWLVIGLLAIAAFLTYRFIRLRLGS